MTSFAKTSLFIGAASFEERSIKGPTFFLKHGGAPDAIRLAIFAEDSLQLKASVEAFSELNITEIPRIDRLSSKSLWGWVWSLVRDATGDVVIDVTCLPREPLGMLLFALSVKREQLGRVRVLYVSAPPSPDGYATLNEELALDDRWLSRGVVTIRSILGFPGDFASERRRHVVALAGHEYERLHEVIVFHEPNKLSISHEQERTSTVAGADKFSKKVAGDLSQEIALPDIETVDFSANSVDKTFESLKGMNIDSTSENVALVAMNTKLSFIGAALFALHDRSIRMVYAVPEEYNPNYCIGVGDLNTHDITELIKTARTIPVR